MAAIQGKFVWTAARAEAAAAIAEGRLTIAEIAEIAGVNRRQLARWRERQEFEDRIQELMAQMDQAVQCRGIARKVRRIEELDARWDKMRRVIEERAASSDMQDVAGGKTGLLVKTLKGIGGGDNWSQVEEYEVDVALLKELREHEKQAAQELGQWTEKKDLTTNGEPIKVYVGLDIDRV